MQWDYIKGSESDFEGAPDWATLVITGGDFRKEWFLDSFDKNSQTHKCKAAYIVFRGLDRDIKDYTVIAQRQPAAQTRRNDELLSDAVNSPKHYADSTIECIDAIEASMSREEFQGYLKGNVQKYVWRYRHKGGVEDLKKSQWYANRLISNLEKQDGK